jgi:hypothetical protein
VKAIIDILATSIVSTALIAALAYFLRATIGEWLIGNVRQRYARELEEHKASLKISGEIALERLKAQLHAEAAIANIRYSTQYEKAAEVLVGLHKSLNDVFNAVAAYTAVVETPQMGTKKHRRDEFNRKINEFRDYFRENKIFLPRALASKAKEVESELFETAQRFATGVESPEEGTDKTREWAATYSQLTEHVRPLFDSLEEQFRRMLGINEMFSGADAEQSGEPKPPMT